MANLKDFMISKTRVKLMELFFTSPDELYYVREITRLIKEEINAVRRELDKMLGYGLLKSEQRGNRMYYNLNTRYPFYSELRQMVAKTTGLGAKITKNRRKLGAVEFVMFSGGFVEGKSPKQGEVDVLVIGDIVLPELQDLIKTQQEKIGREINYAVFSLEEFVFRKTRRDPFVMDILFGSRVMVIGSETDFSERQTPGV
jgi:DNA-binding transcriptional ArsR family regulator